MGMQEGRPNQGPKSAAAPATVSGECVLDTTGEVREGDTEHHDPRARRPAECARIRVVFNYGRGVPWKRVD